MYRPEQHHRPIAGGLLRNASFAVLACFLAAWGDSGGISAGDSLRKPSLYNYSDANRAVFDLPSSAAMASADNAFAVHGGPLTNPGVLSTRQGTQLTPAYAGFYRNVFSVSTAALSTRIDERHAVAFSLSYLLVPEIDKTDDLPVGEDGSPVYNGPRNHQASEIFARMSWGYALPPLGPFRLGVGAALNGQRKNHLGMQGYGIGVDAGGFIDLSETGFRVTLDVENITTNYTRWMYREDKSSLDFTTTYESHALPHVRLGAGFQKEFPYVYGRIRLSYLSLDFLTNEGVNAKSAPDKDSLPLDRSFELSDRPVQLHPSQSPVQFVLNGRFGAEYLISDRVAIRLGTSPTNRFTFGGGVSFLERSLTVDFAYLFHELAGTYQVAGIYSW